MRTAVIYKSKTGFVKRYAVWLAEELSADLLEASKVNINQLKGYNTVIYGGSLHAVGIIGFELITKNIEKLEDKMLVVFCYRGFPIQQKQDKK